MMPARRHRAQIPRDESEIEFSPGESLRLTDPQKLFWPELSITRRDLLRYYAGIARWLPPRLNSGQPIAFAGGFRCANGKRLVGSLRLGLMSATAFSTVSATPLPSQRAAASLSSGVWKPCAVREGLQAVYLSVPAGGLPNARVNHEPLAPKLVVEVQYDHLSGGRFRHGTKLLRRRPDRAPKQCLMSQVERESRSPRGLLAARVSVLRT